MKRQQIILIVCGALVAVVCLVAGWFLFSAMMKKGAAADARNEAYGELKNIYTSKVFPNEANIERVKEDQKAIEAWLGTVSNLVHKGDLQIDKETPTGFKQLLLDTVRALSAQPGSVGGKVVPAGFFFGFDKYLGESASLPAPEHVDRLTRQLKIIEKICRELYAAKILSIESVARETFEEGSAADKAQDDSSSRPKRRGNKKEKDDAARGGNKAVAVKHAASTAQTGDLYSKQRFTFVFKARPEAFVEALNRLAAMDLFVVVAETEFHKSDDPLTKREATKKAKESSAANAAAAAPVDPASVPQSERIVTDPGLEPPVSVKIDVDVFSFEGV